MTSKRRRTPPRRGSRPNMIRIAWPRSQSRTGARCPRDPRPFCVARSRASPANFAPNDPITHRVVFTPSGKHGENTATEAQRGTIVPVEITIYEDQALHLRPKPPPTSTLDRQAAGLEKGSTAPAARKPARSPRPRSPRSPRPRCRPQRQRPRRGQDAGRWHGPLHGHHGRLTDVTPATIAVPGRTGTTSPGASRRTASSPRRGGVPTRGSRHGEAGKKYTDAPAFRPRAPAHLRRGHRAW